MPDGYTAVKYFQEIPQKVKIGNDVYTFTVKKNVCMAWVKDEHVKEVLNLTRTCCGGNKTHPYRLANDLDIQRWMGNV